MHRIILVTIALAILLWGCETAPSKRSPRASETGGAAEVTVGGEIKVRGQYHGTD